MKKIFLLTAFLLSVLTLQSQPSYRHNIISLGIGPSFTGSGDIIGTGMYNEYLKSLGKWISLNSRLSFHLLNAVGTTSNIPNYYDQQTGISLDLGFNASPFKTGKRYLYLMGGGSIMYYASTYTSSGVYYGYNLTANQQTEAIHFDEYYYEKGVTPGYYFGLGFTENISPHIAYGLKCNFQFYTSGDVIWVMGINIGYDFN